MSHILFSAVKVMRQATLAIRSVSQRNRWSVIESGAFAKTLFSVVVIMLFAACSTNSGKTTQERIEEEVVEKLNRWKVRREAACREKAMEIAFVNADSMILEYAREQKLLIERPSRPLRPEEPALRRPNDTLKLAPFLADSI